MKQKIKLSFITSFTIILCSCQVKPINLSDNKDSSVLRATNSSLSKTDINELDKQYSSFKTKAITQNYFSKKIDSWISSSNGIKLLKELKYARLKNPELVSNYITANPSKYSAINSVAEVSLEKVADLPFGVYINSLNPYASAPVATVATNVTANSFTANWNSVSGATGYILTLTQGANSTNYPLGLVTSYNFSGLNTGTNYSYTVKAINAAGEGPSSNSISATPVNLAPNAPVANPVSNLTSTSFTASWNSVSGATGYLLVIDGASYAVGLVTSFSRTGLTASTNHSYYVQAMSSSGTSVPSNTISFTTPIDTPYALPATNQGSNSFTANWNTVPGATGYMVLTNNGSNSFSSTVGAGVTSTNFTGLTTNSAYTYNVRAIGPSGYGNTSNSVIAVVGTSTRMLQSAHPYTNNLNSTSSTITISGASTLYLTFDSNTAIETCCDFITVLNSAGSVLANYYGGGGKITVPGPSVKIRLTSDYSVTDYGYRVLVSNTP